MRARTHARTRARAHTHAHTHTHTGADDIADVGRVPGVHASHCALFTRLLLGFAFLRGCTDQGRHLFFFSLFFFLLLLFVAVHDCLCY